MHWTTLIGAEELASHREACVVVDCRHDLTDAAAGPAMYAQGHIPGAFFLHQDHDLAGTKTGRNGRHPLPDRVTLRRKLEAMGLGDGKQLVAYDDIGGMMASRLWWLSRWLGHREVAVLDGGLQAWLATGHPIDTQVPTAPRAASLTIRDPLVATVDAGTLLAQLGSGRYRIVDARLAERYRGEVEPLDPVAGHIPGAVNRPYPCNLRDDGSFKPAQQLREEFSALLEGHGTDWLVHHCGSGVTACHNLLAMEYAGLPGASLYPGSWSEWCADASRPVATGEAG